MTKAIYFDKDVYYTEIQKLLLVPQNEEQLFKSIVNAPFHDTKNVTLLSLGIVVFLLVNKATQVIDRVALSDTELAKGAVSMSVKPFSSIKIPLNYYENSIAESIRSGKVQITDDWKYLFIPALTPQEAHFNQAGAGIGCSAVYPLKARDGGALIFSYYLLPEDLTAEHHAFMKAYAKMVERAL